MRSKLHRIIFLLCANRRGQDLVEYALVCGFIVTVAVAVFPAITNTSAYFSKAVALLSQAVSQTANQ